MDRRRIAFLKSGIQNLGGLEKYTKRLAKEFASLGHHVVILTTEHDESSQHGFEVISVAKRSKLSLWQLLRFDSACTKFIDEHELDVIFGMDRNFCLQTHYRAGNGVHAAYLERRKKYSNAFKNLSFAINPLHRLILRMEKTTFESPHLKKLFTNSHMVKKELLRHYAVKPETIEVVHNGVEWHELALPFEEGLNMRAQLIKQLGLNPEKYQFLFVGNEYRRKGLDLLLEALSSLDQKNFQLSVCGKERSCDYYVEKAKNFGLEDRVKFFGQIKEIKAFYSAADSVVIPSMYDPFANVTVEALAMGAYVISSSANGGSEVIKSDDEGLVFADLHDPHELAECLKKAMQKPKTKEQAHHIRLSVQSLDYQQQLSKIVEKIV